jgi:protein deglycase
MPNVFVFMAPGFEEMELVITVDVLRRAGISVSTVALAPGGGQVTGSRGIPMVPDTCLEKVRPETCDMVVLPGGLDGTRNLGNDPRVIEFVRAVHSGGKWVAAICAAPTVLLEAGIGVGKRMTSHPSVQEKMTGVDYETQRVSTDGKIITSRAAGTTFDFAFTLVEKLVGREKIAEVNRGVLARLD